jgi:hypothetical protein
MQLHQFDANFTLISITHPYKIQGYSARHWAEFSNAQGVNNSMDELEIQLLEKFTASPYRQEIELQHVVHRADYVTLRIRIREIKRFTIFDIDERTARLWGEALLKWADTLGKGGKSPDLGEEK